jgi:GAF domain-containing protein
VLSERRARILARFVVEADLDARRVCDVCAEVANVSGAGLMLMSGDVTLGSIRSTRGVGAMIERLEADLGEGPGSDAYHEDRPVLEPDLASPKVTRWVAFTAPAVTAGVRAVFGFPLRVGAIRLGALILYSDRPGRLTDHQHADALVVADLAAQTLLMLQANAPPGRLAAELEAGADFQYVVHQATGMVAAQLEVGVGQALVRLRAHAFGNGRGLVEVAADVVGRKLRFDDLSGELDPLP